MVLKADNKFIDEVIKLGDRVKTIDEYNKIYRQSVIGIVTQVEGNDFVIISRDDKLVSQIHTNWLVKIDDSLSEFSYEEEIGKLQDMSLKCGELARKIYNNMDDKGSLHSVTKKQILEGVIEDLRTAAQRIGWIDTRTFDNDKKVDNE